MTPLYCSEQARARTEPLYGTAPLVKTWLLVEYPGVWWPNAMEGSTFNAAIKDRLARLARREPAHRQLFVRQSHQRSASMCCIVVKTSERNPVMTRIDLATCDGPIDTLDHPEAQSSHAPMYLVCTHGNHDKCCAKFGLPVYRTARDLVGDQAWQCSHVGGDRFAGNLLCFPHGIYYGHVDPADVKRLTDPYARGDIDLKHYRGRCCYPKAVQAAEYFARRESGILRIDDLAFESATRGDEILVKFRAAERILEVSIQSRDGGEGYLTCKAEKVNRIQRYELTNFRTYAQSVS